MIAHQRTIPINSVTPIVLSRDVATYRGAVASTADPTHFVAVAGPIATNDIYNGIWGWFDKGPGAGRDFLVTDYVGATLTFTIDPAYITAPTTATTFVLGPALPGAWSELAFGNGGGIVYYSFIPGGSLINGLRQELASGERRTFDRWGTGPRAYIEFASVAATDTIDFEWV